MKREEIEHLLVEYANGEISPAGREHLEELFKQDPVLRQEADEMMLVWDSMRKAEENTVTSTSMDANFYAMLEAEKAQKPAEQHRVIVLRPNMIRLLIASAACIAAFIIGRVSIRPEVVTQYKTVYVRQPAEALQPVQEIKAAADVLPGSEKKSGISTANAELYEQLRSVYASERIAAVTELSKRKTLDPEALRILGFALREDDNPNVRLMIVNVLQPLASQRKVQDMLISVLNRQEDALVQTSIVDLLVEAKSRQAIPQMITLMENKNTDINVQEKIKDGIEKFLY